MFPRRYQSGKGLLMSSVDSRADRRTVVRRPECRAAERDLPDQAGTLSKYTDTMSCLPRRLLLVECFPEPRTVNDTFGTPNATDAAFMDIRGRTGLVEDFPHGPGLFG